MALEQKEQEDNTRITLQLIAETSTVTRRGQLIGGSIALIALIGGLILVANDKDIAGAAVLILDAVFVFTQKIIRPGEQDTPPRSTD